jgi:hypothetical protein
VGVGVLDGGFSSTRSPITRGPGDHHLSCSTFGEQSCCAACGLDALVEWTDSEQSCCAACGLDALVEWTDSEHVVLADLG